MKQAKEKVWLTSDNKLVKDGHEGAQILFAAEGQLVPDAYVKDIDGAGSFFKDVTMPHPEPVAPAPRAEKFAPGQSNSKAAAGPQEKVGPVKVIGDVAAAVKADKTSSIVTPREAPTPRKAPAKKKR